MAAEPDAAAVARHLRRLSAAYPAFLFSSEYAGPARGTRWVAVRKDRTASGLAVVITGNLLELHKALLRDKERTSAGARPAPGGHSQAITTARARHPAAPR